MECQKRKLFYAGEGIREDCREGGRKDYMLCIYMDGNSELLSFYS